jgi:hypothetical protein
VTNAFRRLSRSSTDSSTSRPMSCENSSTGSLNSDSAHSSECPTSFSPMFRHSKSEDLPHDTTRPHELYPRDSKRYLSCIESGTPREPLKTSFRELAILPTQRVTRYVLLFRGRVRSSCLGISLILSLINRSARQYS